MWGLVKQILIPKGRQVVGELSLGMLEASVGGSWAATLGPEEETGFSVGNSCSVFVGDRGVLGRCLLALHTGVCVCLNIVSLGLLLALGSLPLPPGPAQTLFSFHIKRQQLSLQHMVGVFEQEKLGKR